MTTVAASIPVLRWAAQRARFLQAQAALTDWIFCQNARIARMLRSNKTRPGYARERILKPAGYFFVHLKSAALCGLGGAR